MMHYKCDQPPVLEPVTLDEMKAHGRIDQTTDDDLMAGLITSARLWAERYTRRAFMTQNWSAWLDHPVHESSKGVMYLARAPLVQVTTVTIFDENDAEKIWPSANYFVDTVAEPGRLVLRSTGAWPLPERAANGMRVQYVAGYGDASSDVPAPLRLAIKQLALHWYEHRGEELMPGTADSDLSSRYGAVNVPLLVQALLNPYKVMQ